MNSVMLLLIVLYLIPLLICVGASFLFAYQRVYEFGTASNSDIAATLMFSVIPLANIAVSLFLAHEILSWVIGEIISSIRSRR